jgi:hypothetical protein
MTWLSEDIPRIHCLTKYKSPSLSSRWTEIIITHSIIVWWHCSAHHYLELNITHWSAYCWSGLLPRSTVAATTSCGGESKQWCEVEVGEPCSITSNRASNRKQAAGTSQPPRHDLRSAAHHNNIITKSVAWLPITSCLNTTISLNYLPTI